MSNKKYRYWNHDYKTIRSKVNKDYSCKLWMYTHDNWFFGVGYESFYGNKAIPYNRLMMKDLVSSYSIHKLSII